MDPLKSAISKLNSGTKFDQLNLVEQNAIKNAQMRGDEALSALDASIRETLSNPEGLLRGDELQMTPMVRELPEVKIVGQKTKQSWWDKNSGVVTAIGAGIATVAGIVCLATGAGAGLGVGLLAVGMGLTATSCTKEPMQVNVNNTQIQQMSMDEIIEFLRGEFSSIRDVIVEGNEAQNNLLRQIYATMLSINGDTQDIKELLRTILAKMGELNNNVSEMNNNIMNGFTALLSKLDEMDASTRMRLNQIIENQDLSREQDKKFMLRVLKLLNRIDARQAAMYVDFLDRLDQIIHNQQISQEQRDRLEALGFAILNKIPEGANPNDYMAILQQISAQLANIQGTLATDLTTIISKLDTINAGMLEGFATIIANQNTQITNQNEILAAINSIKPILQAIYNKIPAGYDDSQLRALIAQVGAALGIQMENANATLVAILNAIPEGCHCQTLDLSVVVNLLTQILNKIDPGSGSGSNEGDVGNGELD